MTPIRPTQPGFPDSAAFLRFVSSQSPLAEAEAIRAWLAANANRQASVDELHAAWRASNVAVPAWDKDGVWAKLSNERAVATAMDAGPPPRRPDAHTLGRLPSMAPQRLTSFVARAAAILLVVGASATVLVRRTHTEPVTMREITTTHGERSVIQLDDGTRVTLDAASRLRVSTDLGASGRTLLFWRSPSPSRWPRKCAERSTAAKIAPGPSPSATLRRSRNCCKPPRGVSSRSAAALRHRPGVLGAIDVVVE